MSIKSLIYTLLKLSNDISAIQKATVGKRVGHRIYGKATGKLARKLFK